MVALNEDQWLQIRIDYSKPVGLTDLTLSLLAFSQEYAKFVEASADTQSAAETQLVVKEIRPGSILIELFAHILPALPLLWAGTPLDAWFLQAAQILDWLAGKLGDKPQELSKGDLNNWKTFVEPIAKDHGAQLNLAIGDNSTVTVNQYIYSSEDARRAQQKISEELVRLDTPADNVHRRKLMHWYQTKFVDHTKTGDKVIIEDISKSPVKVIFENDAVKAQMLAGDPRFSRPWHQLAYVVDVEVQTVQSIPKLYTILRYYPDDTIDPAD